MNIFLSKPRGSIDASVERDVQAMGGEAMLRPPHSDNNLMNARSRSSATWRCYVIKTQKYRN